MAESRTRTVTALQNVIVWIALVALAVVNFAFGWADLGDLQLPAVLVVAFVQMTLGAAFYMHLIEKRSAMRLVLPIALLFVGLLLCLVMVDLTTRFAPVVPPGPIDDKEAPERPAPVRSDTGTQGPPLRPLGY